MFRYNWYMFKTELAKIPENEQTESGKKLVNDWLIYSSVASGITVCDHRLSL